MVRVLAVSLWLLSILAGPISSAAAQDAVVPPGLIAIPGGNFVMGDNEGDEKEAPK